MSAPVSLKAIVDALDEQSQEDVAYLNPRTGEVAVLGEEELRAARRRGPADDLPDWQREAVEKAREVRSSGEFLQLPTQRDVHEYAIMARFCESLPDARLSQRLSDEIRGSGAFKRFKRAVDRHGLAEQWYRYRDGALEAIAVAWLDSHNIPYQRDAGQ